MFLHISYKNTTFSEDLQTIFLTLFPFLGVNEFKKNIIFCFWPFSLQKHMFLYQKSPFFVNLGWLIVNPRLTSVHSLFSNSVKHEATWPTTTFKCQHYRGHYFTLKLRHCWFFLKPKKARCLYSWNRNVTFFLSLKKAKIAWFDCGSRLTTQLREFFCKILPPQTPPFWH